jgi:hypothetical protein
VIVINSVSQCDDVRGVLSLLSSLGDEVEGLLEGLPQPDGDVSFPAYGRLYDLPLGKVIGYIFQSFGVLDLFAVAASSDSPQLNLLRSAQSADLSLHIEPEDAGTLLLAWLVLMKNLEAISIFHLPVSALLSKAAEGDDEALFKAVYIDQSVLQTDVVGRRVSNAVLNDDGAFFDNLSKAIKRTRPARPKEPLDEVRLMLALVDECKGLSSVTDSDLTYWATEFNLYPVDGDALQAIRRQRQKYQKVTSHQ